MFTWPFPARHFLFNILAYGPDQWPEQVAGCA